MEREEPPMAGPAGLELVLGVVGFGVGCALIVGVVCLLVERAAGTDGDLTKPSRIAIAVAFIVGALYGVVRFE